jgi:tRNA (guanine37-N1)-methyltransferase
MVMLAEPLQKTLRKVHEDGTGSRVIYLTPQGTQLNQKRIQELAKMPRLVLLAGRYEGVDERLINQEVDEEISIGDYVLSGGELPAMVLTEGLVRYLPGVLGNDESIMEDSFSDGLLDWPQYTRPEEFGGQSVPAVLLGGNHGAIRRWRLQQALGRTWERRPDLMKTMVLSEEQQELLQLYQKEQTEKEVSI